MRAVAVLASLAVLATAAAAATSRAGQPPRSYRVTVRATLQERATYRLTGDAACFWTARGVAVRHLEIASTTAVVLTAKALARGVGLPLDVHEIRLANHNGVIGACARLRPGDQRPRRPLRETRLPDPRLCRHPSAA